MLNILYVRGGGKKNGKGKKGHKKGKKEGYDLIVNINLEDWKLSPEQVNIFQGSFITYITSHIIGCRVEGGVHVV